MGIYRSLLEEEVPHLDDNNNPDEQIKELQDAIEDNDANEAERQAAQDAAYGPDCGVDDIMDESAMAIYEFEAGHAEIMQAIGMHELQEAANGREFIMEAADIKGFFASVRKKVAEFFKKVWSVIQRWAGNFTALVTTNKKFYDKYSSQIEKGMALAKKGNKKPSGYEFDFEKISDDENTAAFFDKFSSTDSIRRAIEKKDANELGNAMTAEDVDEGLNKTRAALAASSGSVSASEFGKALKLAFYGSEKPKENYWMTPDQIKKALTNDYRKDTNEMMKETKKQMKKILEELNSLEKSASKLDDSVSRNKIMAVCARYTAFARGILTATQTWRSARLSALRAYAAQGRRYGMMYVAAANKDTHKGFQKESTEYGFLGSLGLV